ncbi:unnamed protein product, partial [Effrenium voratum]
DVRTAVLPYAHQETTAPAGPRSRPAAGAQSTRNTNALARRACRQKPAPSARRAWPWRSSRRGSWTYSPGEPPPGS